jgi:hypothetical protein
VRYPERERKLNVLSERSAKNEEKKEKKKRKKPDELVVDHKTWSVMVSSQSYCIFGLAVSKEHERAGVGAEGSPWASW